MCQKKLTPETRDKGEEYVRVKTKRNRSGIADSAEIRGGRNNTGIPASDGILSLCHDGNRD